MGTQLIKLSDGLLVEVDAGEESVEPVAAGLAERMEGALEDAQGFIRKAVAPVASVWSDMDRDYNISQVEVELALGFEAEGNLFLAKGKGSANITFKLTIRPPEQGRTGNDEGAAPAQSPKPE